MGSIAVVYQSKSGYTKKYAEWIAKSTDADLLIGSKTKLEDLLKYETIIYGGGLYVGGIHGLKLITKNLEKLKGKKLIVFCLGATPVRPEIYFEVKNKNFTEEQLNSIEFFMIRGGFDYNKLTFIDKILINVLRVKLKSKKDPNPDERGMLNSFSHPIDFTSEKSIEPILKSVGINME